MTLEGLAKAIEELLERQKRIEAMLVRMTTIDEATNLVLTLKEASLYTKVPVETLRKHIRAGKLAVIKPGKTLVFYKKDLDAYLEDHRTKSKAEIETEAMDYVVNTRKR